MTAKVIGKIKPVTSTKTCQGCRFYARYDFGSIRGALERQHASSTLIREYEAVYTGGGSGRCFVKNASTPKQDWCPKWEQKDIGNTPEWPDGVAAALKEPQFRPVKKD